MERLAIAAGDPVHIRQVGVMIVAKPEPRFNATELPGSY